ncbi:MAG TPA: sugar MFS transporter [Chitinophagaceae bacterium]|jgi:fucose permease
MKNKRQPLIVALVFLIFFVISFLTNILGPLVPNIIDSFHLSLALAGFLPFSFFVAYGIMSIPAGILIEKYSEKLALIVAFLLALIGAATFVFFTSFSIALISLFLIGLGMAMLQVVINPLLRVAGGEEHFAFNSVMAQLFFGAASFLSPWLYSYLVQNLHTQKSNVLLDTLNKVVPQHLEWVSLYWVFAVVVLLMIIVISAVHIPKVDLTEDEKIGTSDTFKELLKNRYTFLFFLGTFMYVGTEQGIANWISKFLQLYHGLSPETTGASAVAWFWGLMTIGCVLGLGLLKLFDSRKILCVFVTGAALSLSFALFGPAKVAVIAFPLCGFFASVMWSIVISLGLNSVANHHGTLAGILCTGIVGGAVVPLIIGALSHWLGLRGAMFLIYITLGYLFSMGIWAKPLVNNAVSKSLRDIFKTKKTATADTD